MISFNLKGICKENNLTNSYMTANQDEFSVLLQI